MNIKAEEMLNDKLETDQFLRVAVIEGGCAGLTYGAEIDQDIKEGDEVVLKIGDIRVVSDENSRKYLDGLTIDYSDDLINGGLQFTNSNTKTTCGCGSSFSLSGFPVIEDGKCRK
jgi:iron-sulfur cluster assembly protein